MGRDGGRKEFGVFLPVANGGWIVSSTTPTLDGLYPQNRAAAVLADQIGLDFVMSMAKFRGFGGDTDHWGAALESVTLMAALAEATSRVKIWATLHPLLQNPAVAAKMISTLDHISGGRAGLNIVAGAYRDEFAQMGAWDDGLDHDARYALAEEWTQLVKRLWTEDSVSHEGRFFTLTDCQSRPKPLSQPRPELICAGVSERGFSFAVTEADACFIGGEDETALRDASRRAKARAAELGKAIRTYAMCTIVHAATDAEAQGLADRYRDGVDMGAVTTMLSNWGVPPERLAETAARQGAFMTRTVIGAPVTCGAQIRDLVETCELDGLMLIFPDYETGLSMFGAEILPGLREAYP
ncbi:LLM class flavin-dependent oxidoreductase [Caulobacter endophyticus]|uniref:LLM class flavin-dependent oxidoreductase n=1 Tax=Caulobacter endophyticus TaxID=2172652 RepID=A0A2T9JMH2_9CAUL|nr:LLM class flavin-dependent oxidoreductase [Caulobacter endophyticus]PVM84895.1 LLM class flavin-dependent oxidoreductase [Caulobacter endophyticus]